MRLVGLAGPLTNLLLAILAGNIVKILVNTGIYSYDVKYYIAMFLLLFTQLNIGYAVFNLLPFPPLDGSKIFVSFLPDKWEAVFYKYQNYFYFVVFALYFIGVLDKIIDPVIDYIYQLII